MLIIGGDSMIGGVLAARLERAGARYWLTTRRPQCRSAARPLVDLASEDWADLDSVEVEVAIICAAAARLAQCHADPVGTAAVNVTGTLALARYLRDRGTKVIHLSTNQVLDGAIASAPSDRPVAPVSAYGEQKAAAEAGLLGLARGDLAILRLAKVFGPEDALLLSWCRDLLAGKPITPFSDMSAAPIAADLAARAIIGLAETQASGIFQLSATRDIAYSELARALAERLGVEPALVRPTSAAGPGIVVTPPRYTSLDTSRLTTLLGLEAPDPCAVLDLFVPPYSPTGAS